MKLIVDPRTVAIWSCSERKFVFSSFCEPLFLNRGSRPTRHYLHWRCSPRTAKDSPHPQVLLSLWILPGAQKYKERNLWAHAGTFLKKSRSSPCRTFEMIPTEVLMILPDRFGDGYWGPGSEGEPAVSADTTPQDHPCGLSGAAEEAGISGLCCQGSGTEWLSRSPQKEVTCLRLCDKHVWRRKKRPPVKRHLCQLTKPLLLLQLCWWNMGLGIFGLRISWGKRTSQYDVSVAWTCQLI